MIAWNNGEVFKYFAIAVLYRKNMEHEGHFRIGSLLKTHGLKGELNFFVNFEGLEKIKFSTIFIEIGGRLTPFFIRAIKYQPSGIAILALEDVDTIETAGKLVKKDVYLSNELKPKTNRTKFSLMDLEGFIALDDNHGELGEITEVREYPQQVLATVQYQEKEVLFPLNETTLKGIDVKKKVVYVALPDGLLDIYLE